MSGTLSLSLSFIYKLNYHSSMERTVKLTLLSERATSFSLMVITALLHLPGRSSRVSVVRSRAKARQRTNAVPVKSTGSQISLFFFLFTRTQRNARDDAHHLKKNRLTSTRNRHDREKRGISFFCHALIYYI